MISLDFRKKQRDLRSLHFRPAGPYSENRPRDSRFEYAQARAIRPLQDQTCFRIAFAPLEHQIFQGGFDDNFSGYPEN